jgi:hypothetical protein
LATPAGTWKKSLGTTAHAALVQLVGLDHAVDRTEDVSDEEVLDLHIGLDYGTSRKAR